MPRGHPSPFKQGTPERAIYDGYNKAVSIAEKKEKEAAVAMTEAKAQRSSAERYAEAMRSLGHGDKVTPLKQLPNYAALGEPGPTEP